MKKNTKECSVAVKLVRYVEEDEEDEQDGVDGPMARHRKAALDRGFVNRRGELRELDFT